MDFNRQNNQPNSAFHQPAAPASQPESTASRGGKRRGRKLSLGGLNGTSWVLVLIAVILIVFGLLWYFRVNGSNEISQVNKDEYQAVFLSNGQVYFGKLVTLNDDYAKITNIFYLQVKQTVQPKQGSNGENQGTPTLVKLGSEIHGPEDSMMINRTQIVFWENLKSKGKVSEAIKQYYSNGGNATNNTNSSTPTQPSDNTTTPPASSNSTNSNSSSSTPTTPTNNGKTPAKP